MRLREGEVASCGLGGFTCWSRRALVHEVIRGRRGEGKERVPGTRSYEALVRKELFGCWCWIRWYGVPMMKELLLLNRTSLSTRKEPCSQRQAVLTSRSKLDYVIRTTHQPCSSPVPCRPWASSLSAYRSNNFEPSAPHRDAALTQVSRHCRPPRRTPEPLQPQPCSAHRNAQCHSLGARPTSTPPQPRPAPPALLAMPPRLPRAAAHFARPWPSLRPELRTPARARARVAPARRAFATQQAPRTVAEFLRSPPDGRLDDAVIHGYVRSARKLKSDQFLNIGDGSCVKHLQAIVPRSLSNE